MWSNKLGGFNFDGFGNYLSDLGVQLALCFQPLLLFDRMPSCRPRTVPTSELQSQCQIPFRVSWDVVALANWPFGPFEGCHGLLPRTYPPAFGLFLVKHHERFTRLCMVACEVPDDAMKQELPVFFQSLEWGDLWEDAELFSCLSYIRASKRLHIGERVG